MSKGEIGLNCSGENPGTCDYSNCVYASAAETGLCSKTCDDLSCPNERFACTQTNRQGGGVMNWCALKCASNKDCDSNASCQTLPSGGQICFPN